MADDAQNINAPAPASAAVEARRIPAEADAPNPSHDDRETRGEDAASAPRDDHADEKMAGAPAPADREDTHDDDLPSVGRDEPLAVVARKIDEGVGRVLAAFETKLAYDATKQSQIDRLHEELLQHRNDLVARAARPLVHGMIRLHDDIGKLLSALRTKPADQLTPDRFFSLLEGLQEDVEIVLGHNGVAAYREPGGPFDPKRQRALKKVSTSEEALAGTVAESIRPGFEQGADILEKERVATYEFALPSAGTLGEASEAAPEGNVSSSEPQQKEG